jgi:GNAT superfamily N-acetyltransferase
VNYNPDVIERIDPRMASERQQIISQPERRICVLFRGAAYKRNAQSTMNPSMHLTVRELTPDEFPLILPLVEKQNPKIAPDELRRRLDQMRLHRYHCIAAFEGQRMVGVAGYWLGARLWCGEYLDADNVVVEESVRSRGVGKALMNWLEAKAAELGCRLLVLDSYVTYARAHKFYFREGYEITGYHFTKAIHP